MIKVKLKKTDISRILRALSLLELREEIPKKEYIRLYKKLYDKKLYEKLR
jgi:hypothetical protein